MPMKKAFGTDIGDVLERVGLRRKARTRMVASLLPALSLLFVGAAIGAGVGLAFAPSSGRRLRLEMGERILRLRDRAKAEAQKGEGLNATTHHS
ncbi:MAG TPA: YtxH domain-containing protein [Polyangiaceae bacterium]|nr:YtxH domain-containing protein [Polyangiaceae bacterium]